MQKNTIKTGIAEHPRKIQTCCMKGFQTLELRNRYPDKLWEFTSVIREVVMILAITRQPLIF